MTWPPGFAKEQFEILLYDTVGPVLVFWALTLVGRWPMKKSALRSTPS